MGFASIKTGMIGNNGIQNLASGYQYQSHSVPRQAQPARREGIVARFLKWAGLRVDEARVNNHRDFYTRKAADVQSVRGLDKLQVGARAEGISTADAMAFLDSTLQDFNL